MKKPISPVIEMGGIGYSCILLYGKKNNSDYKSFLFL